MSTFQFTIQSQVQQLPLKQVFRIARGAKTHAEVIVVKISDGQHLGWAEAVPYARYQESVATVTAQIIHAQQYLIEQPLSVEQAFQWLAQMPAGSARNALDCALWDLYAKQQQTSVANLLALPAAKACITAQTLSIDSPEAMAKAAKELADAPLVKVKLDNEQIIEKMTAIHQAAPNSRFIVDANEGWSMQDLQACCHQLKALNVVLIEQPLAVGADQALIDFDSPVTLCADESCHTRHDLDYLKDRYQAINIKLDKTGGLTEAVALAKAAKAQGFEIMLGCMVASSLAMAPAALLVNDANYVDLDGPLLIAQDRPHGFAFDNGLMQPLSEVLWGGSQPLKQAKISRSISMEK